MLLPTAALLLLLAAAPASDRLDEAIGADELLADVRWLADDEREGRGILHEGLDEAAEYAADHFGRLGLETFDAEGFDGYFHEFDHDYGATLDEAKTTLTVGGEAFEIGADFQPFGWSAEGDFSGPLAFAGYGASSPGNGHDDYANVDVAGKVVLVLRYEPFDVEGNSKFTGDDNYSPAAQFFVKAKQAADRGAKALLVVNPPDHGPEGMAGPAPVGDVRRRADIPAFHVTQAAAERLLAAANLPPLAELQASVDATGPASAVTDLEVSGGWDAEPRALPLKNVVAYLPGAIEDEYVVVGAHYDHVGHGEYGSGAPGEIHNGADDNASGTAGVLEVAEALALRAKDGERPRRSVVFALFTAEENGLIGSAALVRDFPVPLEDVVGMVNLDMIGRLREETLYVGGADSGRGLGEIVDRIAADSPLDTSPIEGMGGASDHANFVGRRIPSVFLHTGLHPEYHRPGDDADLINAEGLAEVTRFAEALTLAIADADREALAFQTPPSPAGNRVRLGVRLAEGLTVGEVVEGSVADAAGVLAGDRIVKLGDADVTDARDLLTLLGNHDFGDATSLTVARDGEETALPIVFAAPSTRPTARP